ncbi:hypothetical protein QBC40DRAFT_268842 [Triangularia verruculosa]|uniref:Uncharacterized protein n=1 Tax=Triangularia verruculosa TaxID=2587418 RepID=A0AAN6XAC8_9PEZI|nr:hypothetical protein QBC40DRAFT_268842 [Triangularia verruculosa]
MSPVGFEVFTEGLISQIAYYGSQGVTLTQLFEFIREYHCTVARETGRSHPEVPKKIEGSADGEDIESTLTDAELASARLAWDWLRSRPQIFINGHPKRYWNSLGFDQVLALPKAAPTGLAESSAIDPQLEASTPATKAKGKGKAKPKPKPKDKAQVEKPKKKLTVRPRIVPSKEVVWQTLTHHGIDYKKVPPLEWACLQGVATAKHDGILQSDLRKLVNQDKRSLPKRTDSLFRKGYIVKRTVVVQKMKTSMLWLKDFAPKTVDNDTLGLDLNSPQALAKLAKDTKTVPWHSRWTGTNIDVAALGKTIVGVVKAFGVMRYADLRTKLGVSGKPWQMKTVAKSCQRFADLGVIKYTAACFPTTRKVFKDCLKFIRDPTDEEWQRFLATGKKTSLYSDPSRHREPKPNALALYENSGARIQNHWTPEKPLAQTVFEVIKSAGPKGASNPQVSVATVGYQHRRYLSSYLTKVAETQQPAHLRQFQVNSEMIRIGKTSAYMYKATGEQPPAGQSNGKRLLLTQAPAAETPGFAYGFGAVRPKMFAPDEKNSLSALSLMAQPPRQTNRKQNHVAAQLRRQEQALEQARVASMQTIAEEIPAAAADVEMVDAPPQQPATEVSEEVEVTASRPSLKRRMDEMSTDDPPPELSAGTVYKVHIGEPNSLGPQTRRRSVKRESLVIVFKRQGDPPFIPASTPQKWSDVGNDGAADSNSIQLGEPSPSTPVQEEVQRAGPTRGRGRGRGGGRGRGRKGQSTGGANGQKQYVCDKCGVAWKNSNGLQYHLTAGQNACNTNFDPSRNLNKRRRMEVVSPPPVETPTASSSRGARKTRATTGTKLRRGALRPSMRKRPADEARESEMEFRGVEVAAIPATAQTSTFVLEPMEIERPIQRYQPPNDAPTQSDFFNHFKMALDSKGSSAAPSASPSHTRAYGQPMDLDTRPISSAAPATQPEPTMQLAAQILARQLDDRTKDVEMQDKQHNLQMPDQQHDVEMPEGQHDVEITDQQHNDGSQYPGLPDPDSRQQTIQPQSQVAPAQQQATHPPSNAAATPQESQGIKPFVPNFPSYERLATHAKVRTAKTFDIILYLLNNNDGVFPGEKAVFYASLRIYLATFPGQVPPSLKNCQTAINSLQARKEIDLHTHLLRNMEGRMEMYSVLVRHGMDPKSEVVKYTARKIKEAFPGLYIPPAFSPTPEEMVALQQSDPKYPKEEMMDARPNANGQKFRARRRQITEVEVFNAPYYKQNIAGQPVKDTLRPNHLRSHSYVGQKRQAAEGMVESSSPKRHKSNGGYATHQEDQGDSLVDPELFKPSTSQQQQQHYPPGSLNHLESVHRPSIVEAVKNFRLLPTRGGSKMHHNARPSKSPTKIPEALGRIRNPGLNSLPTSFFEAGSFFHKLNNNPNPELISPMVNFLEPNESLEVDDGEWSDVEDPSWTSEPESIDGDSDGGDFVDVFDGDVEVPKEFKFAEVTTLTQAAKGIWDEHNQKYFEGVDSSFTVDGHMPSRKWQIEQNVPKSIEEMAKKSKLKAYTEWEDKRFAQFCTVVDKVSDWETSKNGSTLLQAGSVAPDFIILNITPKHGMSHLPVKARFEEQKQFTMETLDYQELESDDDYQDLLPGAFAHRKKRMGRPPGSKSQTTRTRAGKIKLKEIKTRRELTAYPQCPEDFLRQAGDRAEGLDWSSENVRLATFVSITTLLGGTARYVDWGLILRLLPEQTISQLRHYWGALKKDRATTIITLTAKFHKNFLKAYENDELPTLNYDDVLSYDWLKLIKWTTRLDWQQKTALPATREALQKQFTLSTVKHEDREWREAYYHPQRSVFNRFQDATSEPLAVPLDGQAKAKIAQDMVVAMSWIRSLCITPVQEKLDEKLVAKRNSLYPHMKAVEITALVDRAMEQLQRMHVISKSSRDCSNGRQWRFNTRVFELLLKTAQQEKFEQAYRYKKKLDEAFKAKGKSPVRFKADDKGMTMVLLNMQAMGRIRTDIVDQKDVPMGHEPGNYETRKYPKEYIHFKMDIIPTEKYVYNDDTELVELRKRITESKPPAAGPGGAVPVWMTCHGELDKDMWIKYLSVVLITLASRGSMRPEELVKTIKPVIMEFEAELIMDWLEGVGVLKEQIGGMARGLGEWWWVVVEVAREWLGAPATVKGKEKEVEQVVVGGNKPRKSLPSARPTVGV